MRRLAVTMALLVVAGGCAHQPGRPLAEGSDGVVPWVDATVAPDTSPASPAPSAPPSGVSSCTAAQLALGAWSDGGAAAGTTYRRAALHNRSDAACYIDTRATVAFRDGTRSVQTAQAVGQPDGGFVVVPPDAGATPTSGDASPVSVMLGISSVCPPYPSTAMDLALPDGTITASLPAGTGTASGSPDCDGGHGGYNVFLMSDGPPNADATSPPIEAHVVAGDPVRLGERYRYLLRLTNTSDRTYSLDPCPVYDEGFKQLQTFAQYRLNCGTVTSIAAGATVTYEMLIDIPASLPSPVVSNGSVILSWVISDSGVGGTANVPYDEASASPTAG